MKDKRKNLSNLYETILSNEKPTKSTDTNIKNIEELKELTTTPKKEKYNEMPHMNVLQANYLQQADLLFLPTAGFGYKYLLVVVDANTLLCDAEPLKTKESLSVKKALVKIYKRGILKIPQILGVDQGSEFKDDVKTWADDNDVIIKTGHINRHRQQALVEAKNKIIGSNLSKILASKELKTNKLSKDWVPYLRPLITAINTNLPNPKNEVSNDEPIITKNNYELLPIGTRVRVQLDQASDITGKKLIGFRSGDVRWSNNIKTVENVVLTPSEPPMYAISNEKAIYRTRQQLLVVNHIFV